MSKKTFKLLLIIVLALGFTSISFAQGRQTGSIHGTVLDDEGNPLPGATITLSGPSLMGTKSYVASNEGKFRFVGLLPGEYEVKVELSGFNTYIRKGLRCSVGKTTECRVRLAIKSVEEEITVTAEAPVVDIESSKMSVHYDTNFLLSIPQGRDLYGITQSLPGAIEAEGGREYTRMTSILGGSIRSTLYQLDGAIMNDPVTTYAAANINVDVYEEIEIGIGSLPAEVGMTDTAVVNIVSKSGGNKFSGAVSAYYTGSGLAENLWSEEQMEALDVVEPRKYANYMDGSVSFGGPIIKDRLWFFLNGRRIGYKQDLPFTAFNRIAQIYDVNPDAFSPKDLEPYDLKHDDWLGFAKLTFQISKNLRYMGMLHFNDVYEPIYSLRTGNSYAWSYTAIVDHERVYTTSHHFNWVLNQNTFLELRGNYVNRHYPNLARRENANNYTSYDKEQGVYWGNTSLTDDYYRKRYGASSSLTRFQDDLLGASHEFKLGVDWEDTIYSRDRCRGYEQGDNPYYTYWRDFADGNKYYRSSSGKRGRLRMRPYSYLGGGMVGEDNTRRLSAFAQDSITTGRLAVNVGLRFSYSYAYEPEQVRPELINYKVGPEFLNPAITDPNILLKALNNQYHNDPGIDYNQLSALDPYTFPYRKTVEFKTLSPRIGLIYDLFGDGKTAIKLSFARYYEPIFSGKYNAPQLFGGDMSWDWYDLNKNGYMDLPSTGPVDPQFIDSSGDKYVLTSYNNQDPNFKYYQDVKAPYMHEFIAGVEHELMKDFRVGAQFIYKENKNITEDVDRNNDFHANATDDQGRPIWLPYTVTDPGWDAEFGTDDDQQLTAYALADYAPTQSYLGTTPEGLKRNYIAGVLTFDKRMSNKWQLKGSIIYSAYKGNASPSYGSTEGENTLLDNPNTMINYYGRTLYDHPLQIKLMGTVILPYDLIVTAYFRHQTGSPWARTLDRVYFPSDIPTDWSYASGILTEPTGSRRNPSYTMLDMRLEKSFSFGDYGKMSLFVDIFNVGARKTLSVERNPNGRLWFYRDPPEYSLQSNYGRINSITGVRSVRVGLRYSF